MAKTFNIYCDESTHLPNDGCPYMLLGYICVPYPLIKEAKMAINDIKDKYGFDGEMKWSNINRKTEPMYAELIEYFFRSNMKFRAVVVKKSEIDESRSGYSFNDFYFRMYYQLLHLPTTDAANTYTRQDALPPAAEAGHHMMRHRAETDDKVGLRRRAVDGHRGVSRIACQRKGNRGRNLSRE